MDVLQQEYEGGLSRDEQVRLLSNLRAIEPTSTSPVPGAVVDVSAERFITDPRELNAVGSGLPIIDGVSTVMAQAPVLSVTGAGGARRHAVPGRRG